MTTRLLVRGGMIRIGENVGDRHSGDILVKDGAIALAGTDPAA